MEDTVNTEHRITVVCESVLKNIFHTKPLIKHSLSKNYPNAFSVSSGMANNHLGTTGGRNRCNKIGSDALNAHEYTRTLFTHEQNVGVFYK
jgi:hypothetical protein